MVELLPACRWALVVAQDPGSQGHIGLMKGAPEMVITRCSHYAHVRSPFLS